MTTIDNDETPISTVGELRALITDLSDDTPVKIHFGWDLAISGSTLDDDELVLFADDEAGCSPVSTQWLNAWTKRQEGDMPRVRGVKIPEGQEGDHD